MRAGFYTNISDTNKFNYLLAQIPGGLQVYADEYYGANLTSQVVIGGGGNGGGVTSPSGLTATDWTSTFGEDVLKYSIMQYAGADGLPTVSNHENIPDANVLSYIKLNGLAQALYSLILTDLGQSVDSNILAFPQRLMEFANKTVQSDANGDPDLIGRNWWSLTIRFANADTFGVPSDTALFYKWFQTGIPQVNASVISTQYICQVPKLRSIGSVIVSVVVADLVLLQALWVVFTWIVTFFLERRHPRAKFCPGCAAELETDVTEMKPVSIASGSGNHAQLLNPAKTPTSPVIPIVRSGSESVSLVSASSMRRRNDATVQPLLPSP